MFYRTREEQILARSVAGLVLAFALWSSGLYRRLVEPTSLAAAKTFTVNVVGDGADTNPGDGVCLTAGGNCSLRAAIQESNAIAGTDNIYFNIPGTGVKTISPGSPLPDITSAVFIDGYTQTGASQNTLQNGDNAVLTIELNGLNSGDAFGLRIVSGGCTVRGLVIHSFSESLIQLKTNGGNSIEGNFIGTNAAGTAMGGCASAPGAVLVGIDISTANNTIGGTTAAARNVISGTCGIGIQIFNANTNNIQGNFIGTDLTGTVDVGNAVAGIYLSGSNNTIGGAAAGAGNIISGNGNSSVIGHGIQIVGQSNSNIVQGNLIGTNITGMLPVSNTGFGVFLTNDSSNNMIGGTAAGAGNLISGNGRNGLQIEGDFGPTLRSTKNTVQGNLIGTNIQGTTNLGNGQDGVFILNSATNTIGGTAAGARNLISGNVGHGVELVGENSSNNLVQGNFIGTNVNGTSRITNLQSGVVINSGAKNNTIGGSSTNARNIISGNNQRGVEITDSGTTGNQVQGNFIGTDASGTAALSNTQSGVLISGGAANNTVGGSNHISFNGDRGIRIAGNSSTGNLITSNSIFANGDIGIDLGNDGVTPNDADDGDSGPNNLQNFPVISAASTNGSNTTINGSLDSVPNTNFTIQFFANESCDPAGYGEGHIILGTISRTTGPGGHANFGPAVVSAAPLGQFITATATDPNNNTSEFSPCVAVSGSGPVSNVRFGSSSETATEASGFRSITVLRSGDASSTVTVDYATSDVTAEQRSDYTINSGTLTFGPGEVNKQFEVLIVDDVYVEANETLNLTLSNPTGGAVVSTPGTATLTINDNDSSSPTTNPIDLPDFFVQQHYFDFLSRYPDGSGRDYWTGQLANCGSDATCRLNKRITVSNAFFYELEYQQTASYVFRLYRGAFGNNQPFPNPDNSNQTEARKLPSYAAFARDRARVVGGASLAQGQLDIANAFVQRSAFLTKYPGTLDGPGFIDAVLATIQNDLGVNLTSQRAALINLYNSGGRGAVMYRLADDGLGSNPINNRAFIDEEYNRAFVATEYFGYLRRDGDIGGFLFWLGQVNSVPLRDTTKQHAMVCSFITSAEYQQRFSSVVTHSNAECQ